MKVEPMDAVLITVTLLSLGVALAMGAASWRLLREQRRRSLARVAALVRASGEQRAANETRIGSDTPSMRSFQVEHVLFGAETSGLPPIWPGRVAVIAVFGGLVTIGASAALILSDGRAAAVRQAELSAISAGQPLELISLQHARHGGVMSITGLVRIPPASRHDRAVSVVASLFDRGGSLVATGQTALELAPTGASANLPFVVEVPVAGAVGRYRVGFRTDGGVVVPHIDRRNIMTAGDQS